MELVIIKIGLDTDIIERHMYTMLFVSALFTTVLTGPLLNLLGIWRENASSQEAIATN